MSYHLGDPLPDGTANPYNRLTPDQLDLYGATANNHRRAQVSGRTWFVATGGNNDASGVNAASSLATVTKALEKVTGPDSGRDDVILLRAGTYDVPANNTISTACTLIATRGPAVLTRP